MLWVIIFRWKIYMEKMQIVIFKFRESILKYKSHIQVLTRKT